MKSNIPLDYQEMINQVKNLNKEIKKAKKKLIKKKTYHNALFLQQKEQKRDRLVKEIRRSFFIVKGE